MFTGTIRVKICEATDLRRTDCMSRHFLVPQDQTLDPYVSLDVDEVHWNKTQPRQKTFTPVWNEWFEHEVDGAAHLGLKIFHDSAVGNDDFVANATVPFDEIYGENKTRADMWVSQGWRCPHNRYRFPRGSTEKNEMIPGLETSPYRLLKKCFYGTWEAVRVGMQVLEVRYGSGYRGGGGCL